MLLASQMEHGVLLKRERGLTCIQGSCLIAKNDLPAPHKRL